MKKILLSLIPILLASTSAHAQLTTAMIKGAAGGGGGFSGQGDTIAYKPWGSCSMAYSAATRGMTACRICTAGDAACGDISSDATTGLVSNVQVIGGTTCNDTTHICTVKTYYCHTPSCPVDYTQATEASRATFLVTCPGLAAGIPCAHYSGGQYYYDPTTYTAANWTETIVGVRTGSFSTLQTVINNFGTYNAEIFSGDIAGGGNADKASTYSTNFNFGSGAATDGVWHVLQSSTAGYFHVDGTSNSSSIGTGTDGYITVGEGFPGAGSGFIGNLASWGFAPSAATPSNLAAINASSHTILGF